MEMNKDILMIWGDPRNDMQNTKNGKKIYEQF